MPSEILLQTTMASLLACLACGLGALPLAIRRLDVRGRVHLGYAFAAGLMLAASVLNLIGPAVQQGQALGVPLLLLGLLAGCAFMHAVDRHLPDGHGAPVMGLGSRRSLLIFIAMTCHSIPEGMAVGVGYASGVEHLGTCLAWAIAIHNIPEGLAIALPARAEGASIARCFVLAALSSATQPLAAIPAAWAVWVFKPLLIPALGFAAGAMMYLVLVELIPEALALGRRRPFVWTFMSGFGLMLLAQTAL
ncbi:MAG: ZIP family metal transporter [Planctomycetota bacterium]|nr:ZIP family metal transporter [Planctomycetota bacterium]